MKSRDITVKEYECEGCGHRSIDVMVILECERKCITQKKCSHEKLEYDCSYEMRSSSMHCVKCGKEGSRKELIEDGKNNLERKI